MCGIFGFSLGPRSLIRGDDAQAIANTLFQLSESRGKEASGIALVKGRDLLVLKSPSRASKFVKTSEYRQLWRNLNDSWYTAIGHSRLVTNGSSEYQINNQPVVSQRAVAVHNGIIVNVDEIFAQHPHLPRRGEVDSEYLVSRFENSAETDVSSTLQKILTETKGVVSTALLFSDCPTLLLASNNGSLYVASSQRTDCLIFSSERKILDSALKSFPKLAHLQNSIIQLRRSDITRWDYKFSLLPNTVSAEISIRDISLPYIPKLRAQTKPDSNLLVYPRDALFNQTRCTRCVLPASFPGIAFDDSGICSVCKQEEMTQRTLKGSEQLKKDLLADSHGQVPRVLVALSGGRDSCFALHYLATVMGYDVVAYTYDWGMVSDLARRNMSRMCGALGVEHIIVSADIRRKRENIKRNVQAWLRQPELGMVPLFMAGDKQFFYFAERAREDTNCHTMVFGMNPLEKTDFKTAFCGVIAEGSQAGHYRMGFLNQLRLITFYLYKLLQNPFYLNRSLLDSTFAFFAYYLAPHQHRLLYEYIPWREAEIVQVLREKYDWEISHDTTSTWRIGDATSCFYNYIYMLMAGFTESDTFRSNQIREGSLTRKDALGLVEEENRPRFDSIRWYLDTIDLDFNRVIRVINNATRIWSSNMGK